jgi:hypothetical protein
VEFRSLAEACSLRERDLYATYRNQIRDQENASMKKTALILIATLFLLSLSCRLSSASQQGYIVYSAVDGEGSRCLSWWCSMPRKSCAGSIS